MDKKQKIMKKIAVNLVLYTLIFTLLCSFVFAFDFNNNLGYWSHDGIDTTGVTSIDISNLTTQYNGTLTNGVTVNQTGKVEEAHDFEESDTEYTAMANFPRPTTAWSVGAWFKLESCPDSGSVIIGGDDSTTGNAQRSFVFQVACANSNSYLHAKVGASFYTVQGANNEITLGNWYHMVGTYDGETLRLYLNGTEVDNDGTMSGASVAGTGIAIGSYSDERIDESYMMDGLIDEAFVMNKSINQTEIDEIFSLGNPYRPLVVVSPQIDLLFANETASESYKIIFDEGEEILGYINWTLDNGTIIDNTTGTCNMTFVEGILEDKSNNTNFTICNTGCDFDSFTDEFEFHSANLTDPVVEDTVRFDACHLSSPVRDLDVSIRCGSVTNSFVVDKSSFPLCSTGTGTVVVNFTDCINNLTINATVDNAAINIGQGHRIIDFEVDREYEAHLNTGDDIIFNETLDLWQTAHTHEYYEQGSKEIFANCSHTNSSFDASLSENITIVNIPPQIFIEQVSTSLGTTTLSEGVLIEFANGTWQWFIAVVDDDIDTINYSWYNSSGDMIFTETANGTPETVNTSSELFVDFDGNPFNLTVFANDTFSNSTTLSITFNVTDTLDPSCDFASRYFIEMGNFTFNVTCVDEHFFSINVTCPVNNQSNFSSGLNVQSFTFDNTFFLNVSDTCVFRYCDGHTAKFLKDVWFTSQKENKQEVFRNFNKVSELWVVDGEIEFEQEHDRLKFKINFDDTEKPYQSVFYNVSSKSSHLFSPAYAGWIADPVSETWFDLNNKLGGLVMTISRGSGLWEFRIYTNEEEVEFESIGELNCVSGSFQIIAEFDYILEPGVCPTTVAGVLTMWMVLGLALFLMSVGWVWRIREPGFFGSLLLITFSWTVVACHLWMGYICAGIGMYFLIWFVIKK